ncbi:MAG: XisI protein [Synechococcales cyanobacterium RM1_1_8]|nr:XisI protein [Synechococcales cyanobacterium RM1_1_8]
MAELNQYRQFIQSLLSRYAVDSGSKNSPETQLVFDTERDHYQVMHVGWRGDRWVHSCTVHLDIKEEKIWIQWNGTEDDLAQELVDLGVPKSSIVIGFHAPSMRKYTDYAAG